MEKKRTRVYLCEDSLEGILSAVHAAYLSRYGHPYIQIEEGENYNLDFFCDYVEVLTNLDAAESVAESVRKKISGEAWLLISRAAMHERTGKGQDIYRFLNYGYALGAKVVDYLGEDHVRRVVFDSRTVNRETERLMGFVRFRELKDGSLFGRIGPKHNQVPLLAPHFADRFPEERWILYDERRRLSAVHISGKEWRLIQGEITQGREKEMLSGEEIQMKNWWDGFYQAIGIDARTNPKLQQQMMPKYYQRYMNLNAE